MAKAKIEVFEFRIKESGTSLHCDFETTNLFELLQNDFISYLDVTDIDDESQLNNSSQDRIMKFPRQNTKYLFEESNDTFSGKVLYGKKNDVYDILNSQTGQERKTGEDEIVCKEYFFKLYIPKNRTSGIFITENISGKNLRTIFGITLRQFLYDIAGESYTLEFHRVIIKDVIRQFFNEGDIAKVSLTKRGLSVEEAQRLNIHDHQDGEIIDVFFGYTIKTREGRRRVLKNNHAKRRIQEIIDDNQTDSYFNSGVLAEIFDEESEISVQSRRGNSSKKLNVHTDGVKDPRVSYEIDVELDRYHLAKFESINEESDNFVGQYNLLNQ